MLGLGDWQLLMLFVGLFVVHDAMAASGMLAQAMTGLQHHGVDLSRPGVPASSACCCAQRRSSTLPGRAEVRSPCSRMGWPLTSTQSKPWLVRFGSS